MKKLLFFFLSLPSLAFSSGIFNPGSGTGGGGGGSSSLQVTRSGVEITSPTASVNFSSQDFILAGIGSTSTVALNPATTDFIHNSSQMQTGAVISIPGFNVTATTTTVFRQMEVLSSLNPNPLPSSSTDYALYLHKPAFLTGGGVGIAFADAAAPSVQASIISTRRGAGIGSLEFYTAGTGSNPLERIRITENGLVGISTGAPTTTLDVFGGINSTTGTFNTVTASSGTSREFYTSSITIPSGYLADNLSFFPTIINDGITRDNYYSHAMLRSSFGVGFDGKYYISASSGTTFDNGAVGGIVRMGTDGILIGNGYSFSANPALGVTSSGTSIYGPVVSSATFTNANGIGVTYGAIVGSMTVSNLASGQCVQAGTGGLLTVSGSACGSGSGGGGGYYVEPATVTFNLALGVKGSTIAFTAFNATTTSATVTGAGGLNVVGTLNTNTISQLQTIYGNDGTTTLNLYDSLADNVNVCRMTGFGLSCKSNSTVGNAAAALDGTGGSSVGIGVLGTSGSGTGIIGVKGVSTQDTGVGVYGSYAPIGNKTGYAVQGITSAAGASSTLYAGHFDGVNSAGSTVYGLWTSATGGASNYGLWVDNGLTNIAAPEGVSITYGETAATGTFTTGLWVSSGSINPVKDVFTVASNNNFTNYTNASGSTASSFAVFTSSVTSSKPNVGVAATLLDLNVSQAAGASAMAAGAFNAIGVIAKADQASYGSLAGAANISAGSMIAYYGGQGSIDTVAGVGISAVRIGTGTTSNMFGINAQVQQSSGGVVARGYALHALRQAGVAGGTVSDGGGVLVDTQTPTAGTLTNSYGINTVGVADRLVIAGSAFIGIGSTGTTSAQLNVVSGNNNNANILALSTSSTGLAVMTVSTAIARAPSDFILTVASPTTGTMLLGVQLSGHIVSSGTTPTLSTCGTTPTLYSGGTDVSGAFTWTGGSTGCTLTFGQAHQVAPFCIAQSTAPLVGVSPPSTTAVTFNWSFLSGSTVTYHCFDGKGG